MQFGKRTFFLALNGIVAFVLLCYFGIWIWSSTVWGRVERPLQASVVVVSYTVDDELYRQQFLRSDIPLTQKRVAVRYLRWKPSVARINSFMGMWAEPLAWWLVFLLASAMLLLTNNTVFSKGTRFQLHKRFPYLSMDEYFPAAEQQQPFTYTHSKRGKPPVTKKLPGGLNKKS